MRNIFIIIESDLRYYFFSRMHDSLLFLGYNPVYITICPTVYYMAKSNGKNVYLIKTYERKIKEKKSLKEMKVLEIYLNELSDKEARSIGTIIFQNFDFLYRKYEPVFMFIYNGTTIFTYTAGIYAGYKNIKTTFFELANLPKKMFIDPKGTNANSYIFSNEKILENMHVDLREYKKWMTSYCEAEIKVKQAKFGKSKMKDFIFYTINKLYYLNFIYDKKEKIRFLSRYYRCFKNRFFTKSFLFPIKNDFGKYIFFPLQVSEDSQILLHSDFDNFQALDFASKRAKEMGVNLVVKPHPAERNLNYIKKVIRLQEKLNFIITMNKTKDLISNAERVITINSTVALESIIMDKKVEILGRSVYKYLVNNRINLAKYIMTYLVDIDFFSLEKIGVLQVKKCLDRGLMR